MSCITRSQVLTANKLSTKVRPMSDSTTYVGPTVSATIQLSEERFDKFVEWLEGEDEFTDVLDQVLVNSETSTSVMIDFGDNEQDISATALLEAVHSNHFTSVSGESLVDVAAKLSWWGLSKLDPKECMHSGTWIKVDTNGWVLEPSECFGFYNPKHNRVVLSAEDTLRAW